jgi:hypothetical protein
MNISFLAPELAKWDMLDGTGASVPELLVLPFFADERPLRGAAGLCDWRLCGRLSRLLLGGRVTGTFAEATLYPGGGRLIFPRLLLFGLGPTEKFDDGAARGAAREIQQIVGRLRCSRYALTPPGRSTGRLSARRALELYLDEAGRSAAENLTVIESSAGQKEAADLARR